jgi:maltooligosyltrehalose trehalohydrolase
MTPPLPQVGAFPIDETRTRFTLWAPLHERVNVRLPASGRAEPMAPQANGYHSIVTTARAGDLYRFEFADGLLRPDPASLGQPQGVHGPSMVMERPLAASLDAFRNPPLRHHVLYELHVGTFTPEGTFDAMIPRLRVLRELGVTAIELMPVAQCPGERNWGYDGVGLSAAQWSYGGLPGLRRLVEACHKQDLAVILDVVYNHLGPEGNYLGELGPYFTDRYKTPWGPALNFDGPESDHVREFFIQNSLFWTRDCGIDGLRLDAVHAIVDHTASTFIEELTARNHAAAERQGRRVLIIAESGDNDPRLVRSREAGGYGLDGCWNDDYHHAVRSAITCENRGYYRAFGHPALIAKTIRDRFAFTGEYSSGHRRRHGAPARDIDRGRLVVFTQNHDQVGNRPLGDRLDQSAGWDGARAAAALVLLSPFTPMLWMGEEYGEPAPFLYFVHHSDPALIEAVRRGRAAEFAEFQIPGGVSDAQDEATFRRSTLAWELRAEDRHAAMLAYYAELLRLRLALDIPGRADDADALVLDRTVVVRYGPDPGVLLIVNTGDSPATVPLVMMGGGSHQTYVTLLDSHDPRWRDSSAPSAPLRLASGDITLKARGVLLLQSSQELA